jgi:hypothetical protein
VDDRMVQHLEDQLANAHTANSELRARLVEAEGRDREANTNKVKARDAEAQLERAHARQQKAEVVAKTATRGREEAEREALRTRGELEELNARIETAKQAGDLFSS